MKGERNMHRHLSLAVGFALALSEAGYGEEPAKTPRPIPLTRPEMKQLLEDMKSRTPRIPLPELTVEEQAKLGERERGYEARLRRHYLPPLDWQSSFGFSRQPDPNMTLDYKFKTQLFWIVSRVNNCQYCLGHQESKLLGAGMTEDEIALLDGDWATSSPAERAAYAFARKLTYEPHRLADADIVGLREHFTDLQILEMILSIAGNNAINRWKEGIGVPQSQDGGNFGRQPQPSQAREEPPRPHTYLTPTSETFKYKVSRVAPLHWDAKTGKPSRQTISMRPPLESRADVEAALEKCRKRSPRLPLVEESKARSLVPQSNLPEPLPQWIQLLAHFPVQGRGRIVSQLEVETKGDLQPLLKAQVSWIVARLDRAWYAVGESQQRLRNLGQSDDQIYRLDGDWAEFTPAERALFTVARQLAASPVVLTDAEVAEAVNQTSPREVVQLISYVTSRASLNRITEAAGLQLEPTASAGKKPD